MKNEAQITPLSSDDNHTGLTIDGTASEITHQSSGVEINGNTNIIGKVILNGDFTIENLISDHHIHITNWQGGPITVDKNIVPSDKVGNLTVGDQGSIDYDFEQHKFYVIHIKNKIADKNPAKYLFYRSVNQTSALQPIEQNQNTTLVYIEHGQGLRWNLSTEQNGQGFEYFPKGTKLDIYPINFTIKLY